MNWWDWATELPSIVFAILMTLLGMVPWETVAKVVAAVVIGWVVILFLWEVFGRATRSYRRGR